jgi:ferric-dicitrate binding protein FerR (iron transport regulator)
MDNKEKNIDDLITGYLAQGLNEEELLQLTNWIDESETHRSHFMQMREVWFSSIAAKEDAAIDPTRAFLQFADHTIGMRRKTIRLRTLARYAAAVLLLCSVAAGAYYWGNENVKSRFADISIEAFSDSKTKLCLPDGTLVWLNANSKVTYSQGFGVNDRKVTLTGEGYFEVAKNKQLPFNVMAQDLCVEVHGTKFNFRNYPEDKEAWVSLVEGSVGLKNMTDGAYHYLQPDQKAAFDKDTKKVKISSIEAYKTSQWIEGRLFFDEALLPDIIRELERSYHVQINIIDPSLNALRFYAEFERDNMTISEVMNLLCATNKMKYSITDKTIILNIK